MRTAVKMFKVKQGHELVSTNTLLLTFNAVIPPKSLKVFYRIIPVEMYVPFQLPGLVIMKTSVLLISDQFVNAVEREIMTLTRTIVHIQQAGWFGWAMVLGSFQCRGALVRLHIA